MNQTRPSLDDLRIERKPTSEPNSRGWLVVVLVLVLILVGASATELKKKAIDRGMITLRRSGLRKVMDGVTTLEEVARETVVS